MAGASRCQWRDAALQDFERWSSPRPRTGQLHGRPFRSLRAARPLRLRQVDAAQGGRRLHEAERRRDADQRARDHRARRRPHDDLPGVRPVAAVEDGAGKRHVPAADDARKLPRKEAEERARAYHREGQPHPRRRQLSAHAVRRHEAARRDRPRHGDGAGHPADGRAVRGARRADAAQMQDELLQLWEETEFTVLFVTHSIAEAIKIGNRILLLSPHPGRVKAEIIRRRSGLGARTAAPAGSRSRSTTCCSPSRNGHIKERAPMGRTPEFLTAQPTRRSTRQRSGRRGRAQAEPARTAVERRFRPQGRDHRLPRHHMGGLRHASSTIRCCFRPSTTPSSPCTRRSWTAPFRCGPGHR